MKKFYIFMLFIIATLMVVYILSKLVVTEEVISNNLVEDSPSYNSTEWNTYKDSSSRFEYSYPRDWEFVPTREGVGLRPKEYSGYSKNEIVTILYFQGKGSNLKDEAMSFDGGGKDDWVDISTYEKVGLIYNYKSDSLNNLIYWFSNGEDAVKIMFRKYYAPGPETQRDNGRFESDFNKILESFKFI